MFNVASSSFLRIAFTSLLFCLLLGFPSSAHAWPPGRNGGWSDVTGQVFHDGSGGMYDNSFRPVALVDWNGDMVVDIVGFCSSRSNNSNSNSNYNTTGVVDTIAVALWNGDNHSFSIALRVQVLFPSPPPHQQNEEDAVFLTECGIWRLGP